MTKHKPASMVTYLPEVFQPVPINKRKMLFYKVENWFLADSYRLFGFVHLN